MTNTKLLLKIKYVCLSFRNEVRNLKFCGSNDLRDFSLRFEMTSLIVSLNATWYKTLYSFS